MNKTSSKNGLLKILLVLILIFLIAFNLYMFKDEIFYRPNDNIEEVGTRNFKGIENLKLTGEVYEVLDDIGNYNGMGILRIKIKETNIDHYDPREEQANYYCLIKNGILELYVKGVSDIKINDSISINVPARESIVYNSGRDFNRKLSLLIYPRRFFDFIKRKGYQEI